MIDDGGEQDGAIIFMLLIGYINSFYTLYSLTLRLLLLFSNPWWHILSEGDSLIVKFWSGSK